ncbi:hypothetical protein KC19_6G021300 [Ceratodon purpureus]|uniref:Uncharacterized protein n=1 Tax=Ceratodon purpureus TaxID=3225 RepID=A0A8T0HDG7_CERPU|nr:hypothetical protein KC19_6G021300 [Ceratodon purpureus]
MHQDLLTRSLDMATALFHPLALPASTAATKPWGYYATDRYGCGEWRDRRARSLRSIKQIVCSVGKHPPEPHKDFSHLEGKPASRKLPKTKKKKSGGNVQALPVLITVNRSDSKWSDSWNTEQTTTLKDLNLEDISVDSSFQGPGKLPADIVTVELAVQKSGWGFFVQAQVRSTVQQQCSRCFKKYSSPLSGSFQAWLTPTQDMFVHPQGKSEENGDPTVVYFPLGQEVADLTGMVRDTIRLSYNPKAICSEECDKLGPRTWEVGSGPERRVDSRWLPLLKAKQNL